MATILSESLIELSKASELETGMSQVQHQAGKTGTAYLDREAEALPGESKPSYIRSMVSSRLLKFLIVGAIGVIVNLLVMALLFQTTGYRDWRASAIASTIAAVSNYLLNNYWTFADQQRTGRALFRGAFLYLAMSAAGVGITTLTYSILTRASFRAHFGTSSLYLFGAQLVSISFGTYLNYNLNKFFTWHSGDNGNKPRPELHLGKVVGPLPSGDELRDQRL
jgi:putative flippase GtrA